MKRRWHSLDVRGTIASRPSSSMRATFRSTARCTRIRGLPRSCAKWIHLKVDRDRRAMAASVKVLFQAALERPTEERAAFLAAAAGEDEALRREVESLLPSTFIE